MTYKILIYKFIKFGIVGFSGMILDFLITYLLKEKLKANKYLANSIGFIIAATNNYIWNRIWTFKSQNNDISIEYINFIMISIIGLGINNLCIYILNGKLKLNFYISKIIAIAITTIWNFSINYIFTFR